MSLKPALNIVLLFIVLFARCDTTEPPQSKASLMLTLEDVSCTEAWLTLKSTNLQIPNSITLKQNDQVRMKIYLTTTDTLLYIDSLLPNQTYKFQSVILRKESFGQPFNQSEVRSNELSVTTMDTTSHNLTWQTFTFGQHSSSVLYDVAIIDKNNIWAVGEIYMKDSLGNNDHNAYNAVHWDGQSWKLKRMYFPTVCGSTSLSSYPAKAIFSFDDGQIWISSSGDKIAIVKDGVQINKFCLPSNVSMSINKIWGSSSNNLFVVGNAGVIAHYNGSSWTRLESGTSLNINDVWGDYNFVLKRFEILLVASNLGQSPERIIISINGSSVEQISNDSIEWSLSSTWFESNKHYFVAGSGIYQKKRLDNIPWLNKHNDITQYYSFRIRGNNVNDVFVVGGYGDILHYNGKNWKHYLNDELPTFNGNLYSVSVRANKICAVGRKNNQAIITLGKR